MSDPLPAPRPATNRNTRTVVATAGLALTMLGLAFASVPLYRLFCQVTGYGGTTMRAEKAPDRVVDREVTVRFDATVAPGLTWTFEPVVTNMKVRLGETHVVEYRATNTGPRAMTGNSSYNVVPDQAGSFFNKLQCFCFTDQPLAAGETMLMPVQFFIDPAMATDSDGKRIHTITLSYTFFPVAQKKAEGPATPTAYR